MQKVLCLWFMIVILLFLNSCNLFTPLIKSESVKPNELKAAFIYPGPVEDAGWTFSHDQARQELERNHSYIKTAYVESIDSERLEKAVTKLIEEDGNNIIVATSSDYAPVILKLADQYPKTIFLQCSGYETKPNLGVYFGRMYQARYLTGIIAGKMTVSNKIGYVAAHPFSEVKRGINAFAVGVRQVNPDAVILVKFTNSWYNPALERESAEILIEKGCDIISQHQDTPSCQYAAREYGVWSIGYNTDMSMFAPSSHLVSAVWNWNVYYKEQFQNISQGQWESSFYWGGLKEGVVDIASLGEMIPQDIKNLADHKKNDIINESFDVFDGPIRDNKGNVKIKLGQKPADQELMNMDYFVEGVVLIDGDGQ